jgi:hypothetical protein
MALNGQMYYIVCTRNPLLFVTMTVPSLQLLFQLMYFQRKLFHFTPITWGLSRDSAASEVTTYRVECQAGAVKFLFVSMTRTGEDDPQI